MKLQLRVKNEGHLQLDELGLHLGELDLVLVRRVRAVIRPVLWVAVVVPIALHRPVDLLLPGPLLLQWQFPPSRRRDCCFADIPSPSTLKRLLHGEGGAAE